MFKILFLILSILNIGICDTQDPINTFDIKGKWYIKETVYLSTNEKMNITFIKCPYLDFNTNGMFFLDNGMNLGRDSLTWVLIDSNIFFTTTDLTPNDTLIFKILNYEPNYMSLKFNDVQINLTRICDEK